MKRIGRKNWKLTLRLAVFLLALLLLMPMALAAPDKPELELTHSGDGDRVVLECTAKMDAPDEEGHVLITLSLQADSRLTIEPGSVQAVYQTEDGEKLTLDQDSWEADRSEGLLVVSLEVDTDMGGQLQCRISGQAASDSQKKLTNTAQLDVEYRDPVTGERTKLSASAKDEIQRKASYSLTLDLNGGSLPGKGSAFVWQDDLSQGQQVNLSSLPQPTRDRYFFDGWTLASGVGAKIEKDTLTVGSGDVTLRAAWTSMEDELILDANGGSGRKVTVEGLTGEDVTIPFPSDVLYSRDGYKLAGWSTTPDGSGKTYTGGESFTLTREEDILYAWWAPQYSLVYDSNGGSGQMPRRVFSANEEVVISENVFTRSGYDFIGWCTSADGRGTIYQSGDTLTLTGDTVLYAQWEMINDEPEESGGRMPLLLGILAALVVIGCICGFLVWKRRRDDDDGPYDGGGYSRYDDEYDDGYDDRYDRYDDRRDRRSRDRYYDREDRYREERSRSRDEYYDDRRYDRNERRDRRRRYDDRYDD